MSLPPLKAIDARGAARLLSDTVALEE